MEDKEKYNKWNSRRWRVSVWAMLSATLLMGYSLYKNLDLPWISGAITLLIAIPMAYIGAESYTKVSYDRNHSIDEK
jgi:hypothetical protein